jgi:tetratricopeptide (TPR) repeat protein
MALRWLGRPREAEKAYVDALNSHPTSTMARIGVVYSQADQNQLKRALAGINKAIAQNPDKWEYVKVKGQVLNWMGRHREALQNLHKIDSITDRELLEARVAGARWGGRPVEARNTVKALVQQYPDAPAVHKLEHDINLEYGNKLAGSFRTASDTDGLTDRLAEQVFSMHAGPANRFDFAVEQRRLTMDDEEVGWRRATMSWSSELSSRFSTYASMNQLAYRDGPSRFFGDGALSYAVSDGIHVSAGAGSAAVDAFRAVQNRISSDFYYTEISAQPTPSVRLSAKFVHTNFSDGVERNRVDFESFFRVYSSRKLRVDVGGSTNWMNHSQQTADFFSPDKFYSLLGKMQLSGRLTKRLEYTSQIGAGAQREGDLALQSPLVATGTIWVKLAGGLSLQFDAARSTSSLERINPGRESYARYVIAAGIVYRFQGLRN